MCGLSTGPNTDGLFGCVVVFPLYPCALTELTFWLLLQEDELRMMRSLIDGEGAVGVVRRIRSLREEIEAAEEEARQTYAVSRCVCARRSLRCDPSCSLITPADILLLSTSLRRLHLCCLFICARPSVDSGVSVASQVPSSSFKRRLHLPPYLNCHPQSCPNRSSGRVQRNIFFDAPVIDATDTCRRG